MPRPPGALRRFWRRHPWWVDSIVAGSYLIITVLGTFIGYFTTGELRPLGLSFVLLAASALGAAALLVRRRRPWVTFAAFWVATVLIGVFEGSLEDSFGLALALYALAVYRSSTSAWAAFGASALAAGLFTVLSSLDVRSESSVGSLGAAGGLLVVTMLIGTLVGVNIGGRRNYVQALLDRAEQLVRDRDQQVQLATAAERARITREMHDVVAHSVSIMVSLSDGAHAVFEREPDRSRAAVREIGDVGRRSLAEMRRLLSALGGEDGPSDGPSLQPQPQVSDLPALIMTLRAAGLPVTVQTRGAPPSAAGVQTAVYRIVQEALTNALRYAVDATQVIVRLDYLVGGTEITVTDDGLAQREPQTSVGSNRGLIGMRERAQLYGGTLRAEPLRGRGWRVHVKMPEAKDDE